MKKLLLSVAALFVIGIGNAQDTLRQKRTPRASLQLPVPARTPSPAEQQNEYRPQDKVIIHHDEIPATMIETLQNAAYKGWENSIIYQDRISGEYSMKIKNASTSLKTYRFDSSGKPIEDDQTSAADDDQ